MGGQAERSPEMTHPSRREDLSASSAIRPTAGSHLTPPFCASRQNGTFGACSGLDFGGWISTQHSSSFLVTYSLLSPVKPHRRLLCGLVHARKVAHASTASTKRWAAPLTTCCCVIERTSWNFFYMHQPVAAVLITCHFARSWVSPEEKIFLLPISSCRP